MPVCRRLGACSLALHLLLTSAVAHAQVPPRDQTPTWAPAEGTDVVYLKDGQQIRGTLTELRVGQSAKVRLAAGDHVSRNDKNAFDVVWGLLFLGPGLPLLLVGLSSPKKTLRKDASDALWTSPSPDKQPFYVGFGPTRNGGGLLTIGRAF